jgi:hypothetical protein
MKKARMKALTVRRPESLINQIEEESRARRLSMSAIVRERLVSGPRSRRRPPAGYQVIADLIGSVEGLPTDLSNRTKHYLKATGYGRKERNRWPRR